MGVLKIAMFKLSEKMLTIQYYLNETFYS